jgi:hypothetical protein
VVDALKLEETYFVPARFSNAALNNGEKTDTLVFPGSILKVACFHSCQYSIRALLGASRLACFSGILKKKAKDFEPSHVIPKALK